MRRFAESKRIELCALGLLLAVEACGCSPLESGVSGESGGPGESVVAKTTPKVQHSNLTLIDNDGAFVFMWQVQKDEPKGEFDYLKRMGVDGIQAFRHKFPRSVL